MPISSALSCGIGSSCCIHAHVSATVPRSGRHDSPAASARAEETFQAPAAVRHSGISVHGVTSWPDSHSSSTARETTPSPGLRPIEPRYPRTSIPRSRDVAGRIVDTETSLEISAEKAAPVPNERLRATLLDSSKYDATSLAEELGLDPKSVQRWITRGTTPHRSNAYKAAQLLGVPVSYLWPGIDASRESASLSEIVSLYPHRSDVPRDLWLDLLASAEERVWLYANASLFLPEDNPESIEIIRRKAERGADVRILMADPDSEMCARRGIEEQLFEAIPARVRMALAYYAPLAGTPGVDFRLQAETLYNSIFTYDDAMLINQHVYGMYGYMAPILHLRRMPGGDFFDMYLRSFQRVWDVSSAIETSGFWRQREEVIRRNTHPQAGA